MHTITWYITSTVPNIFILGLAAVEVAHDFVPKIKNWLLQQNIQNSFDTWHGRKAFCNTINIVITINNIIIDMTVLFINTNYFH